MSGLEKVTGDFVSGFQFFVFRLKMFNQVLPDMIRQLVEMKLFSPTVV